MLLSCFAKECKYVYETPYYLCVNNKIAKKKNVLGVLIHLQIRSKIKQIKGDGKYKYM